MKAARRDMAGSDVLEEYKCSNTSCSVMGKRERKHMCCVSSIAEASFANVIFKPSNLPTYPLLLFSQPCRSVYYCGKTCQVAHRKEYKKLCPVLLRKKEKQSTKTAK